MDKHLTKRLLSVEETARYLGLSPRTVYNGLTKNSKKPFPVRHKKLGKLIKFELKDVDAYLNKLPYMD